MTLYVLAAMLSWLPVRTPTRLAEYRTIARACVHTSNSDPEEAVTCVTLASLESGFKLRARNRRSGARGAWQLLGGHVPENPDEQAHEAMRRWHVGRCLYTGETARAPTCPLADARYFRALDWLHEHPFAPGPQVATLSPWRKL